MYANSGWQYEGQFGSFLGTVIASNYFITAKHIGGSVGDTFVFSGVNYTTTAVFPDPRAISKSGKLLEHFRFTRRFIPARPEMK